MRGEETALVIGSDGSIGRALTEELRGAGKAVAETTRRRALPFSADRTFLDLNDDMSCWEPPGDVAVAYLCAGVSSLERCRVVPRESARVNVDHTVALAERLVARGTFVVFPSTNLVFDGTRPHRRAEDPVCPRTEYGRQKADAERRLLALGESVAVVRLSKVLGPAVPLLSSWVLALRNNRVVHPFSDVVFSPVPLTFTVQLLRRIGELRLPGVVQISGTEDITYEQVARRAAERIGVCHRLVRPVTSNEAGVCLEAVPSHTTLDTTRLRAELFVEPPDVWSTVDSVLGP